MSVALLDVDGTLVDTNYQHARAWYLAFREHGVVLPIWRIHRHVGMGGDQLVRALTDEDFDRSEGDQLRDLQKRLYEGMIEEVSPMPEARELLEDLHGRGHKVLLASSAREEEIDHYLDLLDARELADDWTSSADVERTKPHPDLVHAALEKAGAEPREAVMVGDSPWDAEAAGRAHVPTIAVMCGGFAREELADAGAIAVYESVEALREGLDDTPLA